MPLNSKNWNRTRTKRYRAFGVTLVASLLAGCGGYFANEWPNLAEGFADAAERDAALEEAASEQEVEPAEMPQPVIVPTSDLSSSWPPEAIASPESVALLESEFEEAANSVSDDRRTYEAAKAAFLRGDDSDARGRWLTAQLKLTALNRTGDKLYSVMQELLPVYIECLDDDMFPPCVLGRRTQGAIEVLNAYLAEERTFLAVRDPAGSN